MAKKTKRKPWRHAHGPLGISATPVRFKSVGFCIYCGSTDQLSDEHVIPYSLGGNYVLPHASCELHRVMTSDFERCTRTMFGGLRARLEMQTVRPADRVREVDIYPVATLMDLNAPPIGRGPSLDFASLVLPTFHQARLLAARPFIALEPPFHPVGMFLWRPPQRPQYNHLYGRGPLEIDKFARMLAKIGLGLAYGHFPGRFRPVVRPVILGEEPDPARFVGTDPRQIPPTPDSLHWSGFNLLTGVDGIRYLTCSVRLFSGRGAPIYTVIVGDELQGFTTDEDLAEEIRGGDSGGAPFWHLNETAATRVID